MNLRDYLHENGITQSAFGRLLNPPVSQGKVNHWMHGTRRVSLLEALQIQRLTQGTVTLEELAQIKPLTGHKKYHPKPCQADSFGEAVHASRSPHG